MDLMDEAERLWRGELDPSEHHPWAATGELAEVADGVAFLSNFANVSAFRTGAGLVLVDTGSPFSTETVHSAVRAWDAQRVDTVVFTHGHIDHVSGVDAFAVEARERGWQPPRVVAHEAVARRFDRYRLTAGWNAAINRRQFGLAELDWPANYRYPDLTYSDAVDLDVGGTRFELRHARGETDDATWVWIPERGVLCTGDLFVWSTPNAGNPQKVQRYPREWAAALRSMADLGADVLLPGHGPPIVGADRVVRSLTETAELLEYLHDATVALMNEGARLDEILHAVEAPAHLLERPYLRPVYDEPEFVVRSVWRLYGGWYDGNPANLKPAPEVELAAEVAALAGGAALLAGRARELVDGGRDRLAGHLAELARLAAPDDAEVLAAHAEVFGRRRDTEPSTMAKGVFGTAARESEERLASAGRSGTGEPLGEGR